MIRKRRIGIGAVFVTLGIALAVAFILPAQWLVVVLALALVCSGITLCRNCCEGGVCFEGYCF